jgi:hypothetical protein
VVSFTPRPLYRRGKGPRYPLDRRLGGPQSRLDAPEKRKFLTLPGLELRPLGRPARSHSLYRLSYPGSGPTITDFKNTVQTGTSVSLGYLNREKIPTKNTIKLLLMGQNVGLTQLDLP